MNNDDKDWSIGASEAAAPLGLSPYRSPFAWWAEKTGRADRSEETEATRVGTALEAALAAEFERVMDVRLEPTKRIRHPEAPWLHATPDRFLTREGCTHAFAERWEIDKDEIIPVEFKTGKIVRLPTRAQEEEWGAAWSDVIPQTYAVQVQQQIDVTNAYARAQGVKYARRAFVFALIGNRGFAPFLVEALHDVQSWIRDELEQIVGVNLALDVPLRPETEDDWDAFSELVARPSNGKKARRPALDDEADLIRTYYALHTRLKEDEKRRSELRARIVAAIGNGYAITAESDTSIITALFTEGSEKERDSPRKIVDDITEALPTFDDETQRRINTIIKRHTSTTFGGRQLRVTEKAKKQ